MPDRTTTTPTPVDDSDLGVATWAVLLRTHAAVVRRIEREVEEQTGLPLSWYDVLLELHASAAGRLRMQELASRVVLSRTRVSRLVDDVARAGLVAKEPDPDDGRATLAVITPSGRSELRRVAPVYVGCFERHFADHVTPRELRAVHDALSRVLDASQEDAG